MIHLPLQQPDRVCPPPPLLHAVVALHMCQPVQRLVGMVIHPAHRLLQCCAVDALTRRHGPDSGVSPLMLGHRGRHSYGNEQQTRKRIGHPSDTAAPRLQLSPSPQPNNAPLLSSQAAPQNTKVQPGPQTAGTPLRGHGHPRRSSMSRTREALEEDRPTRGQRVPPGDRRLGRAQFEGQRSHSQAGPHLARHLASCALSPP